MFFGVLDGSAKIGVWMFFILSAYLMTQLYLERNFNRLPQYAAARVGRVFPLYYLILFISLPFQGWLWWRYQFTPLSFFTSVTMLQAPQELWAVPTEVQFYGCFALFWWAWQRGWSRRQLAIGVAVALVLCLVVAALQYRYGTLTGGLSIYLPVFMIGVSAALYEERLVAAVEVLRGKIGTAGLWTACALGLLASVPHVREYFGVHIPARLDPVAWLASFLFFALTLAGTSMAARPLVWLGEVSYGLYLIHHLVLTAAIAFWGRTAFVAVGVVAISLALAELSFRYFEKPLNRWIKALPKSDPARSET
jgi:peptidoglycan/LPS O-acetylase OafA/YrhL